MQDDREDLDLLKVALDQGAHHVQAFMQHVARVFQHERAQAAHLAAAPAGTMSLMSDHMAKWTHEVFQCVPLRLKAGVKAAYVYTSAA